MRSIYLIFTFFVSKWDKALLPAYPNHSSDFCRKSKQKASWNSALPKQIRDEFSSSILISDCKVCSGKEAQKRSQYASIKDDFQRGGKSPLKYAREAVRIGGRVCMASPNSWEVFQSGLVRLIGCLHCILWSSRMQITGSCAIQACNPSKHFGGGGGRILSSRSVWAA